MPHTQGGHAHSFQKKINNSRSLQFEVSLVTQTIIRKKKAMHTKWLNTKSNEPQKSGAHSDSRHIHYFKANLYGTKVRYKK